MGTGRSPGTKIVLFPSTVTGDLDFAIGVELGAIWNSVATNGGQFKWYAGSTVPIATLTGAGNLDVSGTLTTGGVSVQTKPYVAFRFAGSVLSGNNNGQIATANISLGTRTTGQVYTFTFSPAHPRGLNYTVMATPETLASFYICSTLVVSDTSFSVSRRNASNTGVDGNFCVMTVP